MGRLKWKEVTNGWLDMEHGKVFSKDRQALALKRNFLEEVQDAQSKSEPVLSKTRTTEEQAGTVLAQTD